MQKDARKELRVPAAVKADWEAVAAAEGKTLASFIRDAVDDATGWVRVDDGATRDDVSYIRYER